jgi:hypothetical protein
VVYADEADRVLDIGTGGGPHRSPRGGS